MNGTLEQVDVLVAGAGPVGLAAAIELGRRGCRCLVVERNDRVGYSPRAKTTNVRTREHLRRWGIADALRRASPIAPDYPPNVVFATRMNGPELARFEDAFAFLSELHALKVDLFLHQQGLDTTTPAGKALFQMMGVFAEFERAMIQERVRAGLRRAKDEGKQLGRPRIAPELEKRILGALKAPGRTEGVRKIAARFGVNASTVQRISRPFVGAAAPA